MTAGIAKMTMNDTTIIDHTNSGIRLSDIPGARCLNAVTRMLTATISADSSVKVIICAHVSERLPGSNVGPESGVYANQPASGPAPMKNIAYRNSPPAR